MPSDELKRSGDPFGAIMYWTIDQKGLSRRTEAPTHSETLNGWALNIGVVIAMLLGSCHDSAWRPPALSLTRHVAQEIMVWMRFSADRRVFLKSSSIVLLWGLQPLIAGSALKIFPGGRTRLFSVHMKCPTAIKYVLWSESSTNLKAYEQRRNRSRFDQIKERFILEKRIVNVSEIKGPNRHELTLSFQDPQAYIDFDAQVSDGSSHMNTRIREQLNVNLDVYLS